MALPRSTRIISWVGDSRQNSGCVRCFALRLVGDRLRDHRPPSIRAFIQMTDSDEVLADLRRSVRRERRDVTFLSEHARVQADSGRQKEATFHQQTDIQISH